MLFLLKKWFDRNLTPEEKGRRKAQTAFDRRVARNPFHRNEEARRLLGDARLVHFFRAVRENPECRAVIIINERLDEKEILDGVFIPNTSFRPGESGLKDMREGTGYHIKVHETDDPLSFDIKFGFIALPLCGDGGYWHVVFDEQGNVVKLENFGAYIS